MTTQTLTKRIRSPEDIQAGDYITITHTRYQLVPGNLDADVCGKEVEPISIVAMPCDAGEPKKVISVCLPFVMTRCMSYGIREVVDTRRHVIVKVDKAYAKSALRDEDKPKSKRKKKKNRKGKNKKNK